LNLLSELETQNPDLQNDPLERMHALIECMRLAFADTRGYVGWNEKNMGTGDGGGETVKVTETAPPASSSYGSKKNNVVTSLLSKEYAEQRIQSFSRDSAAVGADRGTPDQSSCTVSFQVVDSEGNAVSMVNSNYMGFGTGFIPKGCSFTLQNRGHNFSLDPEHPNCVAPGKRPFHTIIPAMSTWDESGDLHATYSNMGGFMQPQGHMQLLVNLTALNMNPQSAIDAPRFCIEDGTSGGVLTIEQGTPNEVFEGLAAKGHTPMRMTSGTNRFVFGRAQVIAKDVKTGSLWGGSDGRADGCAIGY
jgi:gamma-glutamyltranspeptidase/glutathione hydrolase